jgi:putative membrane protein
MSVVKEGFENVDNDLKTGERSLPKALIAGAVAGLAATALKMLAERYFTHRAHSDPAEKLAEKLAGHRLDRETRENAGQAIQWGFGALSGAAYGALAEFYPAATAREGATFGLVLMGLTEENALPALGLAAAPEDQSLMDRGSETASHVLYGVVTEKVRRVVRPLLD